MNPRSAGGSQSPESALELEDPFAGMRISSACALQALSGRSACARCRKSRKYFCYSCCEPVPALQQRLPRPSLPIKIDIIKHRQEIDGKSTAVHAAVLAPDDVTLYTYPDVPEYDPAERVLLVYPSAGSRTVASLFAEASGDRLGAAEPPHGHHSGTLMKCNLNPGAKSVTFHAATLPVDRAVFIDSTWNQSRGIYKDERLRRLPAVVIQSRVSQFWRHQKNSPRWYLSTVEAVHQLLVEMHVCAWGRDAAYTGPVCPPAPPHLRSDACTPYNGQYDDLLYFFKHMYEKIHTLYRHEDLQAYKRPVL